MPPFRPYRATSGAWRGRLSRWVRNVAAVALLLAAAWYLWGMPGAGDDRVAPTAGSAIRTIDGDSFTMPVGAAPVTIRIEGIDAPEYRQLCSRADGSPWPCGAEAFAALSAYVLEPGLDCGVAAEDRYNRRVAHCRTARTPDIGAAMVARGLAIANGRGDYPAYWQEQERAEDDRTGIWQGRFDRPADWRRAHPR
jgi:endonuclease YncB( thermonuclease family)